MKTEKFQVVMCILQVRWVHRFVGWCFRGGDCVHVLIAQSCPTLCNLMDCTLSGSSVHGVLQARIEWAVMPFSRDEVMSRSQPSKVKGTLMQVPKVGISSV